MPIQQTQLETWSHQGATGTSSQAYASIKHALEKSGSPLHARAIEIFLHGSYANGTHVYAESDVDVVVLYPDTFHSDLSALPPAQRHLHEQTFPTAAYQWKNLRDDVLVALKAHYGQARVTQGNKAIKVGCGPGRMVADVVPAVQYRRYSKFAGQSDLLAYWGIRFEDAIGREIVNYPKYHIERGESKNSAERTTGRYKPTIRVFKNLRNYLVDSGLLGRRVAPSYYLECALHNVPDDRFVGRFVDTVPGILDYLSVAPYAAFMCQNGVTQLFGDTPTQWSATNFAAFLGAARAAWDKR